jgi:hypothetical protein
MTGKPFKELGDGGLGVGFQAISVRRTPRGEREITWASLSREVVDLVAEANEALEVELMFVADSESAMAKLLWAIAGPKIDARQLADELRSLLEPFYRLTPTVDIESTVADPVHEMAVVPIALIPGADSTIGFRSLPGPRGRGILSHGTDSGPDDLVAAMLAEPNLRYRVRLSAVNATDVALRESLRLIGERPDVARDMFATLRALGQPVRVAAALVMTADRAIPLRARAAVRGWFDGVQLTPGRSERALTTASLAAALLRLPTFDDQSWHGFAAETWRTVPVTISSIGVVDRKAVRIGMAHDALGRARDISLGPEDLLRHVHILGQTGTGKSSLMAAIAQAAAEAGYGLMVLDPHSTLIQRIVCELPEQAIERTWLVRPGVVDAPIRLNPLAVERESQVSTVIQDLSEIFYALFDPQHQGIVGPRFEQILRVSLRSLVELVGTRASLADVPRILADPRTEQAVAELVTDQDLKDFWQIEGAMLPSNRADIVSWFSSKFDTFMGTPEMQSLLATGEDSFDPGKAMDEGRIVLLDLDRSRLGLVGSRMTGLLYLTRFWTAAFERANRRPFIILADEAHTFTATALPAIAAEGRKFGIGLVVAHQHPEQLDANLRESLDGNAGTVIAFRSGRDAALSLASRMHPEFDVDDLADLPDLTAAMVSARHARHSQPFTLLIDHNERCQTVEEVDQQPRWKQVIETTEQQLVEPLLEAGSLSVTAIRERAAEVVQARLEASRAAAASALVGAAEPRQAPVRRRASDAGPTSIRDRSLDAEDELH